MYHVKRALAALVAAVTLLSFAACHKAGETVLTIEGVEIPSGIYLALQIQTFNQFTTSVQETVSSGVTVSSFDDYKEQTLDGISYVEWVRQNTMVAAKQYAAVEKLFEEYGLALNEEDETSLTSMVDFYWNNQYYNYAAMFEPNGVSKASYTELMRNTIKRNKVFLYHYDKAGDDGKGGLSPVPDEELKKVFDDTYILADTLTVPTTQSSDSSGSTVSLGEEEIAAIKEKLDGYAERINSGKATFAQIQKEYNGTEDENDTSSTSSGTETEKSEKFPTATIMTEDSNATLFGLLKSKKAEEGFGYEKAYVIQDTSSYYLAVLHDVTTDPFYMDNAQYRSTVLYALREDTFNTLLNEKSANYNVSQDDGLIRYYSPKKIKDPTSSK